MACRSAPVPPGVAAATAARAHLGLVAEEVVDDRARKSGAPAIGA